MRKYREEMVQRGGMVVFFLPDREELSSSATAAEQQGHADVPGRLR
jgi:hypothetical protein